MDSTNLKFVDLLKSPKALLWDLDGTLIDSLAFDLEKCPKIVSVVLSRPVALKKGTIETGFFKCGQDFWEFLFEEVAPQTSSELIDLAHVKWLNARLSDPIPLLPGVNAALKEASAQGLTMAVVSNNPTSHLRSIVNNCKIESYFDLLVGCDGPGRAKKPDPSSYIYAMNELGLGPEECIAIEDSRVGATAARLAGIFTVVVGTGSEDIDNLARSGLGDIYFSDLELRQD